MKQCWKSNTENTQLTDSETAGGNKGTHPKMQWESKTGTLKISNSGSRNSHFWREAPSGRLKAATQGIQGTWKQLKTTFNCWQEHTGRPNGSSSTIPGPSPGKSLLCCSQWQDPLELSSGCNSALRREQSFRKQFKFLIQLQYLATIYWVNGK